VTDRLYRAKQKICCGFGNGAKKIRVGGLGSFFL